MKNHTIDQTLNAVQPSSTVLNDALKYKKIR